MRCGDVLDDATVPNQKFQHCCEPDRFESPSVCVEVPEGAVSNDRLVETVSVRILDLRGGGGEDRDEQGGGDEDRDLRGGGGEDRGRCEAL